MTRLFLAFVLATTLLVGCASEPTPTPTPIPTPTPMSDEAMIRALIERYIAATNRYDMEAVLDCFTPRVRAEYGWVIEDMIETSQEAGFQFRLVNLEIKPYSPNRKYVTSLAEGVDANGRVLESPSSFFVEKIGSEWFIDWQPGR